MPGKPPKKPVAPSRSEQLKKAASRPGIGQGSAGPDGRPLANAELVRLQVRVIALENLLIAVLADASSRQLTLAREMAPYISPRAGFTPHGLTLDAAAHMIHLVDRAGHFRACDGA